MRHFAAFGLACLVAVAWFAIPSHLSSANPTAAANRTRIGTYDSRAIAVAYFRSAKVAEELKALSRTAKPDEMRRRQTLAHLQGFGKHPVDDILEKIKDRLPEIAKTAGVCALVARLDFAGGDVETVDVTDALVRQFTPDEKTLKTIEELKKQKPVDTLELLAHED